MTTTFPTRPTPTRLSTDYVFVYLAPYVATTGDTVAEQEPTDWVGPLPNVIGHSSSEDANDEEWRHYGTGAQTELDTIEYPVTLTLEASTDLDELGQLLGFAASATDVNLADSTSNGLVHVCMVGFSSASPPVLVETEYWEAVQWTSVGSSGSAGTSVTYKGYELTGKAGKKFVTDGSETYNPTYSV